MKRFVAFLAAGLCAGPAMAQAWNEVGDAPDIINGVQMTVGAGALTTISGATSANDFVDAYCIHITDPASFYATGATIVDANASVNWDLRLWLFDSAGNVMLGNDDTFNDGLQSTVSDPSTFTAISGGAVNASASAIALTPGNYTLVIGGYNGNALDASGAQIITLSGNFSDLHGPNTGVGPLASWTGGASGTYTIALNGAGYCEVPTPGALASMAFAGLFGLRRRRR
jgi:MYXO-CTERM domain-containing protein